MAWEVVILKEVEAWLDGLSEREKGAVLVALQKLGEFGPSLGRPLVDHVKGSKIKKLKELRPTGTSLRCLFAFDSLRRAVLLTAGDKRDQWNKWYGEAIPRAESAFSKHADALERKK
jgi:hypothetical protein